MELITLVLEVLQFIAMVGGAALMAIFGAYASVMIYDELKLIGGAGNIIFYLRLRHEVKQQLVIWEKAKTMGRHRIAAGRRTVAEVRARIKMEKERADAEWMGFWDNIHFDIAKNPLSLVHSS